MTTAIDNVIRFPEGSRGAGDAADRARVLREGRDVVAQKLRETLRSLFPILEDGLLDRGDKADEREERNFCYGGREFLRENAVRIEGLVAAQWLKGFDSESSQARVARKPVTKASGLDELALVDFGEMDEQIAVKALAGRLRDGCEEGLYAAGRRLAYLAGGENESIDIEEVMAEAVQAGLKESAMPDALRVDVLREIERLAVDRFAPVIHDLNAFLVGRNILPKLKRSYAKAPAEAKANEPSRTAATENSDVFAMLQRLIAPTVSPERAANTVTGRLDGLGQSLSLASVAAAMEQAMASLDSLQQVVPVAGALPTTSVLRDFRSSAAGQGLGQLDAVTVDIVATLFDFIFDDPDIADPIKAVVARMQIPVLKVAMLDKTFFSSKAHPARRLLDGVSRAAARLGRNIGHDDPLYVCIVQIVERLQAEYAQDASLFDVLCGELDVFLDQQETQAEERAAQAAPLVAEREKREMAAVAADEVLAKWLSGPLPSAVADLLSHEWRALLVRYYTNGDDGAWQAAVATAEELVASVAPQVDGRGRKELAARLPNLVKNIHDGLDRLHVAVERRLSLLDCLFSVHAAVLRGAAPVVTTLWPEKSAIPEIVSESIESGDTQLDCISLVDTDNVPAEVDASDAHDRVAELRRGDWVEFTNADSGVVRYRLSWVSPERGILLFTNPQSPRALSVSPAALTMKVERGEAVIVPVEPIFDRAVNRALETLKAA